MKENQWVLIKTIVDKALTLSGSEKDTYLANVCLENPEIYSEIEELLQAIEVSEEKRFMRSIREERQELLSDLTHDIERLASNEEFIGKKIGPYRISEQLGTGGMGTVFKGERIDEEFHHLVAIKLIKQGVDSEENIRRFKMEREILAALQHPNIAQLYDGGITEKGVHYLIMEYIDGIPIDGYCNEKRLTVNERLNLFKDICRAVQFAHTNLIVHRDLKAQNIYVTANDVVKILDFGIAKLLDTRHTETTLLETRPGQKLWTPQYAAPEQVKGGPVTTAVDVYALGVLLHKLLTGTYPLDLEGMSLTEVEEIIRETTPSLPSQILKNHPNNQEIADNLRTTSIDLVKALKGDLDSLILKTLRKEPEYRYASVNQLLEDIERYQAGLPLFARKGTLQYRTSKFFRRHRTGVALSLFISLAIIGFTSFYTWQITAERDKARLEQNKAEEVSAFITNLFRESSPGETYGDTLTVRHALDVGAKKIRNQLHKEPQVKAKMMTVLGEVHHSLGLNDEAENLLEEALQLQNQISETIVSADKIQTLYMLASVKYGLGKYEEAANIGWQALSEAEENLDQSAPLTQSCRYLLSNILHFTGDREKGFELMNIWFANVSEEESGADSTYADKLLNKATFLEISGNFVEAEPIMREALQLKIARYGEKHFEVANALDGLANIVSKMGRLNEAELLREKAIEIYENIKTDDNTYYGTTLMQLAFINEQKGNYIKSDSLYKKSIAVLTESFGTDSYQVKNSQRFYGKSLIEQKRFPEALIQLEEAAAFYKKEFGEDYLSTLRAEIDVAIVYKHLGQLNKAEDLMNSTNDKIVKKYGSTHYFTATSRVVLSSVLMEQGRLTEAERLARLGLEALQEEAPPDYAYNINIAKQQLAVCLTKLARYEEAEPLLIESMEYWRDLRGLSNSASSGAVERLIELYEKWGKPEIAEAYKNELVLLTKD